MDKCLLMVSAFVNIKNIIDKYVKSGSIQSFVIGKTENILKRQDDERYLGYKLHKIAEDTPEVINCLEKAMILLVDVNDLYKSLHEEQIAGGGGNENANKLYVAVKTQ